jgi:hypothetical protein
MHTVLVHDEVWPKPSERSVITVGHYCCNGRKLVESVDKT